MAGIKRNPNGERRDDEWILEVHNVCTNERLFMVWHYVTAVTQNPMTLDPEVFSDLVNGRIKNSVTISGLTRKEAQFIQQNIGNIPMPMTNHRGRYAIGYDPVMYMPFAAIAYPKNGIDNKA